MITSFRIKNLRSIGDSGSISLKKINILVGKNSSGKSTILRFLPLLRQSMEQPTKGPLLWYGRLVDFGSFENAARDNDVSRGTEFEFQLSLPRKPIPRGLAATGRAPADFSWAKSSLQPKVRFLLGRGPKDRVGNIRQASVQLSDDSIEIHFNDSGVDKLSVLGKDVALSPGKRWGYKAGKFFPLIVLLQEVSFSDDDGDNHTFLDLSERPFFAEIAASLRVIAHGRTSDERLASIASRLMYAGQEEFFSRLIELPGVSDDLVYRLKLLGSRSVEIANLRRYVLLSKIPQLVQAIDDEVGSFAASVKYVEPLRATAERYYRQQDLAVDEIDSRGGNTAMFLESLSPEDLRDLQEWMKASLGFWVVVEAGVGHVQVKIADDLHMPRNIADLGFGYSQLLPIALQLWRKSRRASASQRAATLLAIEQPELHLHPDFQARLADVIASCAQVAGPSGSFRAFIETHSDHLINRFGRLVADGVIEARDIQVLVVTDARDGSSDVRVVSFNKEGLLDEGWPVGFFTPGTR